MVELCQEAVLQMAPQNALEKVVGLLNDIPLHDGTEPHLRSAHLVGLTNMVGEMFMTGFMIGIQATENSPIAHHNGVIKAHQEAGALPDTTAGEVGATPAAQVFPIIITAETLCAVAAL